MQKQVAAWVTASTYDLETARAMLASGRYLYVLFCCQQAVEKRLKALVVKATGQMPPRTHDLARLLAIAQITPDESRELFLRRLGQYYIESRYPDEMQQLAKEATCEVAASYLRGTEDLIAWFDQTLTSN